ncbi:YciI family protein [Methanoregula sp.]|uniref:YciI family protein n=1 Tax=Methanoregula sp. TaxID=2052170 RepID=UPI003C750115
MPLYALLFKGGLRHSELSNEYSDRFVEWAKKVASSSVPGSRFMQEGRLVSTNGVTNLKFDKDTIGGYMTVESESYEKAVAIAKECPILENDGYVEVREVIKPGS